ncbi:ChbG/HpnK family deacetylase [Comamonas sp. NLF-1-9]|uniref:ChbG/HpnK family deacetylase n=1 Tax=Comamonas sp. NLF-1-9 TaxID=2853163 RepID=UPI001C455EBE|nr:ChbG/HpnK family deacetylase [Comamonas sp. NLF-1-9]QXL85367.1 ChbG/HpnK family deacetylase [Comamonas sp. NLF-1-9]
MSTAPAARPKPLVLCADDYAQGRGVSQAIRRLAAQGRLSATSAMVLAPRWPEEAAALAPLRGQLDVGLHLDWTSAYARAAGHGLGLAAAMARALLGGFERSRAREVIERQLDLFEAHWQAPPDHVDGHQHVQQFAGIREPLVQLLVRRYGADRSWLRVSRPAPGQADLKSRTIALMGADALTKIAADAGVPSAKWLCGIYDFKGDQAGYARRMGQWLESAPAGALLMCHPGDSDADSDPDAAPDPIADARGHEAAHLGSSAFGAQLARASVRLVRGSTLYRSAPPAEPR